MTIAFSIVLFDKPGCFLIFDVMNDTSLFHKNLKKQKSGKEQLLFPEHLVTWGHCCIHKFNIELIQELVKDRCEMLFPTVSSLQ